MSVTTAPALLDTAVPMYAAGTPHAYRAACQWVMTEVASGRLQVVIDVELLQEILHRYGALGRYADAVNMARDVITLVPNILPITAVDMQTALAIFQQYAPQGTRCDPRSGYANARPYPDHFRRQAFRPNCRLNSPGPGLPCIKWLVHPTREENQPTASLEA